MQSNRFTLLEALTTVAITMVLAAIGLPLLNEASLKAKEAEVRPNLNSILDTLIAYQIANDGDAVLLGFNWQPLGKQKLPFVGHLYFDVIDWKPDGDVYARYNFDNWGGAAQACELDGVSGLRSSQNLVTASMFAIAWQDLDGDGAFVETIACEVAPGTNYQFEMRGRTGKRNLTGTGPGPCSSCGTW